MEFGVALLGLGVQLLPLQLPVQCCWINLTADCGPKGTLAEYVVFATHVLLGFSWQ